MRGSFAWGADLATITCWLGDAGRNDRKQTPDFDDDHDAAGESQGPNGFATAKNR
ncbi:hypothetical protein [Stratiformator vulcanicus]|uniref:Uncharacterized protein n=1 Tax=Stratiformator vulcanicus TaxID=2527980 RepID=A0A517R1U9_9PLAN|nr:hypothetical protein [Stratiformator vulcanicus]QDT37842.1 hypothetical protein Pan189_22240 [Stratiformator vulcanicus]